MALRPLEGEIRQDQIFTSRDTKAQDVEYEFSHHNGFVHIGRCHWVTQGDGEQRSFTVTEGMTTKLDHRVPGLLHFLKWTPKAVKSLAGDKIEIKVDFIGLNIRVCWCIEALRWGITSILTTYKDLLVAL